MADRLVLTGITAFGRHGVLPPERTHAQPFVVDVVLELDLRQAGATDELSHTVDYGQLASRVAEAVASDPVDLIETLAERIASRCLDDDAVDRVTVTVHKPQAPVPVTLTDVAVTIERSRA